MQKSSQKTNTAHSPKEQRRKRRFSEDAPRNKSTNKAPPPPTTLHHSSVFGQEEPGKPMSPDDIRDMEEHLRFLCKHRKNLQLKINAKEDLLLNGAKEPTERGVCLHLLRKVDRNCVEQAIQRITDPHLRIQLLQGVVRFSTDIEILILYLETLRETQSRSNAAGALSLGLKRINFDKASKIQMSRVLDLILTLFPKERLPQILFGLLQSPSFKKSFDQSSNRLPLELADIFVPIRTLFTAIIENELPETRSLLRTGLGLFMANSTNSLKEFPESTRRKLFELELALTEKPSETDKVLETILDTVPKKSRTYSNLGLSWVKQLLRRHNDEKARKLLNQISMHHPHFALPKRWLNALDSTRVGRIAIAELSTNKSALKGFWLDKQQPVFVRLGSPEQAIFFEQEAHIHQSIFIPSIAPFVSSGIAQNGQPYLATALLGQPATKRYQERPAIVLILEHLEDGLQLLWCLGKADLSMAKLQLQDCSIDRRDRLWLQNLSQCERDPTGQAIQTNFVTAKAWCESQLLQIGVKHRPVFAKSKLEKTKNFQELMQWATQLRST